MNANYVIRVKKTIVHCIANVLGTEYMKTLDYVKNVYRMHVTCVVQKDTKVVAFAKPYVVLEDVRIAGVIGSKNIFK